MLAILRARGRGPINGEGGVWGEGREGEGTVGRGWTTGKMSVLAVQTLEASVTELFVFNVLGL